MQWNGVREPARPVPEAVYHRFWRTLRFPRRFTTVRGNTVLVLDGGRPNRNAGPDFVEAVLLSDGELRRGAVEIHVDSAGWIRHGHHTDPRYARVILQVVGSHNPAPARTARPYRPLYTVVLPEPAAGDSGSDHTRQWCRQMPVSRTAVHRLTGMGWERIREKARRFRHLLEQVPAEQLWYRFTLRSLGYRANASVMERVARRLPWRLARELTGHLSPEHRFEFLLGLTGYAEFYDRPAPVWEALAARYGLQGFPYHDWKPLASRPANHPLFRLHLFLDALETWLECWRLGWEQQTPQRLIERLRWTRPLPGPYQDLFRREQVAIGQSQATEVLINSYLPLWLASAGEASGQRLAGWAGTLPSIPPYRSLEKFIRTTRWADRIPAARLHPLVAQGFLRLQTQWCQAGACRRCPVLSRRGAAGSD